MAARAKDRRLRSYLVGMLLTLVAVISVLAVGVVVMRLLPRIDVETKAQVQSDARIGVQRAQALTSAIERRVTLISASLNALPGPAVAAYLQQVCDKDAMLAGLGIEDNAGPVLTRCAGASEGPVHRITTPLRDGRRLVLTFAQTRFLDELMVPFRHRYQLDIERTWVTVVDANGQVLARADDASDGTLQSRMQATPRGEHRAAEPTGLFGWTVVASAPTGWYHPRLRRTLSVCGLAILSNLLLGLALTPLWARRMEDAVRPLVEATDQVAQGLAPAHWPQGPIRELNELSDNMAAMAHSLAQRQHELQVLNAELEVRVAQRTEALAATNADLTQSIENLQTTRADLQRAEKLASLGGLVAGVAHELNTPLGNGLMAVSTLRDDLQQFREQLANGLRQSALDRFLRSVELGTGIASRNLERAADLVTSFKQIAVDQTSEQRRTFDLATLGQEILLTLRPTFARTPYTVTLEIASGLKLDSFPGALGQILTNLITNAIVHGFDGRDHGRITVRASVADEPADDPHILLQVADDGRGIADTVIDRMFEPFVTTRMGRGGTGLGLHIAHTAASHILGGALTVQSTAGQGTVFTLRMPRSAPRSAPHGTTAPAAAA